MSPSPWIRLFLLSSLMAFVALASSQEAAAQSAASRMNKLASSLAPDILPLLESHCYECHNQDLAEADIDLSQLRSIDALRRSTRTLIRVRDILESRQMPPKDSAQLSDAEHRRVTEWVRNFLLLEAEQQAGDPGPVLLRRLNNAEYTYTIRDLTGVNSLSPAQQFPVDGAAGEGFTNTGESLVMSPSLVSKYLDAAKEISKHLVLEPNGIRFSEFITRRDWTDENLAAIQSFYERFSEDSQGREVELHGLTFPTDQGGLLPLRSYLLATLTERSGLAEGSITLDQVADKYQLNRKYLGLLWQSLNGDGTESHILNSIRDQWSKSQPEDVDKVIKKIRHWQGVLWKFNPIGHLDRPNAPKSWMEANNPIQESPAFEIPLTAAVDADTVPIFLVADTAGEVAHDNVVVWKNARLEGEGRPPLLLRDLQGVQNRLDTFRKKLLHNTAQYLTAAHKWKPGSSVAELSEAADLSPELLAGWMNYLSIGDQSVTISGHFTEKVDKRDLYIHGWGSDATPSVVANYSDQTVIIPGTTPPRSVVAHPSPTQYVAVGWQSPIEGTVQIKAEISDAHNAGGNGIAWILQHRTRKQVNNLGKGEFDEGGQTQIEPIALSVKPGEVIAVSIGPRAGNHGFDLTLINFTITEQTGDRRVWDLAADNHADLVESNPHKDQYGNLSWHFYQGPVEDVFNTPDSPGRIPANSLLATWEKTTDPAEKDRLAEEIEKLVTSSSLPPDDANAKMIGQIRSLLEELDLAGLLTDIPVDPRFGRLPTGEAITSSDLAVTAPQIVRFDIPVHLAKDRTLKVSGKIHGDHRDSGIAQLRVTTEPVEPLSDLSGTHPIVSVNGSEASQNLIANFDRFRQLFPAALCYQRIVPIDEVVTLTLYYRQDDALRELMLSPAEAETLDGLWNRLLFVAQEPLIYSVAFEQIREFSTQDRPDLVVEWNKIAAQVEQRTEAFRRKLKAAESIHLDAILEFAADAWRRPLAPAEALRLRDTYSQLRARDLDHETAAKLLLARVLVAPAFLYRLENPSSGVDAQPVSDLELANRLSYFLWSSTPDQELRQIAEAGDLRRPEIMQAQVDRMLAHPNIRRMAIHFGCQWMHLRDFDKDAEKNEKLYPDFVQLRGDMYKETVKFFEHLFCEDGSILDIVSADYTFLNERLADHYQIPNVKGEHWRRVDDVRQQGRGGILGMATFLASQSGASRTSPILRGNWVYETLLGERLPKPPADVPQLPESLPEGLDARTLIEMHSQVEGCAKCHLRIDPYGFALEQYDTIGRSRSETVNTRTQLFDGQKISGFDGLTEYLGTERRDDVVRQFCRKLLGYALAREVQLSDELFLQGMHQKLRDNEYRFSVAVKAIVESPQFQQLRGADYVSP